MSEPYDQAWRTCRVKVGIKKGNLSAVGRWDITCRVMAGLTSGNLSAVGRWVDVGATCPGLEDM